MASRKLEVEIIGDSRSLERAFGRASSSGSTFGRTLGRLGKVAAVGVGAVFAGLAATLKVGFDELAEGQRVAAQTGAVLKSTGGAANVTAGEVEKLAGSLSRLSGVDDEAIQAGENLLLTFTGIRNEVGAGNDIFNQATVSILDMSVALGQDMKSSAIQLGKALNDPVKGVTALQRVGVSFTAAQKDQIAALVKSGKTLEAQKLILAELNKEFGGSAKAAGETLPGQLSKLKIAFEEAAGGVAQTLLPHLTQLLDWTNRNMPTIQRVVQTTINAVVATINFLVPIIAKLVEWFRRLADFARKHWATVQQAADRVLAWYRGTLAPAVKTVLDAIQAFWRRFGGAITQIARTSLGAVIAVVRTLLGNLASVVNVILAVLRGDWGKAWDELKEIPRRTLGLVVTLVRGFVGNLFTAAKALGQALVDGILAALGSLADLLADKIRGAVSSAISRVKGFFGIGSPSRVTEAEIGRPLGEGVVAGFVTGSAALPEKMKDTVREAIEAARDAIGERRNFLATAIDGLVNAALAAFDRLSSEIETRTEKKLRLMDERAAAQSRKQAIRDARRALTEARAAFAGAQPGEGEDLQEFADRIAAAKNGVVAAQKTLDEALAAQQRFHLEQQAIRERLALENRRALQRRHLEEQLAAAANAFQRGALSLEQYNLRVLAILRKFHVPMRNAALALGGALAEGLREAFVDVQRAARALAQAIANQLSKIRVTIGVDLVVNKPAPTKPPGREHGGPVLGGRPYVVGERGPELFVPGRSGTIVPGRGSSVQGLHVENLFVNDPVDVELLVTRVAQRLAFR